MRLTGPTCRHPTLRRRPSIWTCLIGARMSCQNSCRAERRRRSCPCDICIFLRQTHSSSSSSNPTRVAGLAGSRLAVPPGEAATRRPRPRFTVYPDATTTRGDATRPTTSNLLLITDSGTGSYHRPPRRHVCPACLSPPGCCASH